VQVILLNIIKQEINNRLDLEPDPNIELIAKRLPKYYKEFANIFLK